MPKFVIQGGVPLNGTVVPSGNKNAALPLLAACLLSSEPVVLDNVPRINDVFTMRALLEQLGTEVEELTPHKWRFTTRELNPVEPDPELCQKIRASILLAGPLVARRGYLDLPSPGGDVIGRRRIDTHLLGLNALGAKFSYEGCFRFTAEKLMGAEMLLDEASVTATENIVMAAVLAEGQTIIRNAASEPHVQQLCHFLNNLGARISGIGSNVLTIEGVNKLGSGMLRIEADYLEVISFVGAALVTNGSIRVKNADAHVLDMVSLMYKRLGVEWYLDGDDLVVPADQKMTIGTDFGGAITKIEDAPWPGFPADLLSTTIVVATQCEGSILFHEKMFESRLFFTDKLNSMGARIVLCDPHRCIVQGPAKLQPAILESPDIRAGMALLIAALAADGESVIKNIGQIDRGYERVEEKLRALGAKIERIQDDD